MLGATVLIVGGLLFQNAGLIGSDVQDLRRALPAIQSWTEFFPTTPGWKWGEGREPLNGLLFWAEHWFWRDPFRAAHWLQAGFYGLCVAGFVCLFRALITTYFSEIANPRRLFSLWWGGGLFALHPLHVETAAWLSARGWVLAAAFLTFAWALGLTALQHRGAACYVRIGLSLLLGLGAMFSHTSGLLYLPGLWLWTMRIPGVPRRPLAWLWIGAAVATAAVSFLTAPNQYLQPAGGTDAWLSAWSWSVWMLIFPWSPGLYYPESQGLLLGVASLAAMVGGLVVLSMDKRPGPRFIFRSLLFLLLCLGSSWLIPSDESASSAMRDRSLVLAVGGLFFCFLPALRISTKPKTGMLTAVLLFYASISAYYAYHWTGPAARLANYMVRRAPLSMEARSAAMERTFLAGEASAATQIFAYEPQPAASPSKSDWILLQSLHARASLDLQAATEFAVAATEADPRNGLAWQQLGVLRYFTYRRLVQDPEPGQTLPRFIGEGRIALQKAVLYEPRDFASWYYLGLTNMAIGDHRAAFESLQQAVTFGGNSPEAKWAFFAAKILPLDTWNWKAGVQSVKDWIATHGNTADDWFVLGNKLHNLYLDTSYVLGGRGPAGPLEEAVAAFEEVLKRKPRHYQTYFALGLTYASLANFSEARAAFEKTVQLGPGTLEAQWAQMNLDKIQDRESDGSEEG